jgi:hypothetical protein
MREHGDRGGLQKLTILFFCVVYVSDELHGLPAADKFSSASSYNLNAISTYFAQVKLANVSRFFSPLIS